MGILSNIILHKKFSYCLTCRKFIGNNNNCNQALEHAMGKKHRKCLTILFKTCIADPFRNCTDVMYSHVVKGAKLDISELLTSCNGKNLIYDREKNLICLFCQDTVSTSTNGQQIKKDLVHHLDSNALIHSQLMKEKASWIYNLPNFNGYILLKKASVYCSICDIYIDFVDELRLHAAVGHLETSQHKNNAHKEIAQDPVLLDVTRAGGSEGLGISAPSRNDPLPSQGVQQPPRRPVNTNKTEYDSIKRLLANPMFAPHVQFLEFRGNSFMCVLCDVPLTISSGSFNLEEHIVGSTHRKYAETRQISTPDCPQTVKRDLDRTSPQDQIDKLSRDPEFAPHVKYLQITGDQCHCLICHVPLTVSIKLNDNLKQHIQGASHKKRFEKREKDSQNISAEVQMSNLSLRDLLNSINLNK